MSPDRSAPRHLARAIACAVPVLLLASGAARADIYKWVDDKGVVNYSATPPAKKADAKSPVKMLEAAESRLSVYTPVRPAEQTREPGADASLRNRVQQLEDQLAAERGRRAYAAVQADERKNRAYEECVRARLVDCDPSRASSTLSTVLPYPVIPVIVGRAASVITPTFFVTPPVAPVTPNPGWGKPSTTRWK